MQNDQRTPIIFAHRGASAYAPENTLASFELAIQQGAPAIECDAKLTADGHVVIIHDPTLERTTNGMGRVSETTLAAIRTLDAGSSFAPIFHAERVPTIDEMFASLGKRIFINVELTNYASPRDDLPQQVARFVKKHGLEDWVMFSSFNPIALWRVHQLLPEVPLGFLLLAGRSGVWARRLFAGWLPHQALHPALQDVNPDMVAQMHRLNRQVNVYTVNRREDLQRMMAWGVDGVFTDDPILAKEVFSPKSGLSSEEETA